jgi:hypothetical protein
VYGAADQTHAGRVCSSARFHRRAKTDFLFAAEAIGSLQGRSAARISKILIYHRVHSDPVSIPPTADISFPTDN